VVEKFSKYGCYPTSDISVENQVATLSDPTHPLYDDHIDDPFRSSFLAELQQQVEEKKNKKETDEWLYSHALKVLDNFWYAIDETQPDPIIREEWNYFKLIMSGKWTKKLQQMLLLITAMVSCRVPLSAMIWTRDRFVPVSVRFEDVTVIGLLAKHTCRPDIAEGRFLFSIGRHARGKSLGRDLFLGDPHTKVPVGLLPDFLGDIWMPQEYVEKLSALYKGPIASASISPSGCIFSHVALEVIEILDKSDEDTTSVHGVQI
jgi:hypothetical protein